jgi:redox-sensitive bicupin YhaK (pirin superfamily)
VLIHQDFDLYGARLEAYAELAHSFESGRIGWLQVARGSVELDGQSLEQGDGAAIEGVPAIRIEALEDAEVLLFDMARGTAR